MQTKHENVLVFGATGDVGGYAAVEAHREGAKVWLAMRDTSKKITNITTEEESNGQYHRVKADLSDPDSISQAVQQSKAKAAFIYCAFGVDAQKMTEALKSSGIEYVVFLSSYSVHGKDLRAITHDDPIAFFHSQVEIALQDSGLPYTSLRPGYFATNLLNQDCDKSSRTVSLFHPEAEFDFITPIDIGTIGGKKLVHPPESLTTGGAQGPNKVKTLLLLGPEPLDRQVAWDTVNNMLGEDSKYQVKTVNETEFRDLFAAKHYPPPIIDTMVNMFVSPGRFFSDEDHRIAQDNFVEYLGREPTTFKEFVAHNLDRFK